MHFIRLPLICKKVPRELIQRMTKQEIRRHSYGGLDRLMDPGSQVV